MDARLVAISIRTYGWLLRLYPGAFRRRFSDEMTEVFAESCREAWRRSGVGGLVALWLPTASDLATSALGEHALGAARCVRRDAAVLAESRGFGAAALVALVVPLGLLGKLVSRPGTVAQDRVALLTYTLLHAAVLAIVSEALVRFERGLERRRRARRSRRGPSSRTTADAFRRVARVALLAATGLALGASIAWDGVGAPLTSGEWLSLVLRGLAVPAVLLLVAAVFFSLEPLLRLRPGADGDVSDGTPAHAE